jgi:hypothetical protein
LSLLPLIGLAGLAGALAAWLTVLLLVFPAGRAPGQLLALFRGQVISASTHLADFAGNRLLAALPSPARLFESLGPDRFRREIFRSLRSQTDNHVDDVMGRRNAKVWGALSVYARSRIYMHVQRRLPYVVDNFVEHVHRDLDEIISPAGLVRRYFEKSPEAAGQIFLAAFGADLRAALPLAAVGGGLAGWLAAVLIPGVWQVAWVIGIAALAGSLMVPVLLLFPRNPLHVWPLHWQGIVYRRRRRYLRILAARLANEALAWRVLSADFLLGSHSDRVRVIMRREVSGILDTALFKATLQLLIGPEGVVEVKRSALEKAMDVLTTTPVSATLQEGYRIEVERTLLHAADTEPDSEAYEYLWKASLGGVWKVLPPLFLATGFAVGALATVLFR